MTAIERTQFALLEPGIIGVTLTGRLPPGSEEYLVRLDELVREQAGPFGFLYDALALEDYDTAFALAHIEPFRRWGSGKLRRVGGVYMSTSIRFAIATISLASKTTIRSFAERGPALEWLRDEAVREGRASAG